MKTLRPKEREADVQRTILDGLAAMHVFAFRINTAAFTGEHKGKKRFFRSHSLGPGCADILAIQHKLEKLTNSSGSITRCVSMLHTPIWIEVKRPGEKQTPEQIAFEQEVTAEGHRYICVSSWEQVVEALR